MLCAGVKFFFVNTGHHSHGRNTAICEDSQHALHSLQNQQTELVSSRNIDFLANSVNGLLAHCVGNKNNCFWKLARIRTIKVMIKRLIHKRKTFRVRRYNH